MGYDEITVEELTKGVMNDVDWFEEVLQDIQRELAGKQKLLASQGVIHTREKDS